MSIPPSSAANLPLPRWAYVPGETEEAEADHETLCAGQGAGAVALSRLCAGAASGAALRHRAQRPPAISGKRRRSWKRCGRRPRKAAASGSCCGPASRSPTPICGCGCRSRTRRRGYSARRWANSMRSACARRSPAGDGFADGFPTAALAALLKAKLAQPVLVQGRLGADRRHRPNMKQNADLCVLRPRRMPKHALLCILTNSQNR